MKRLVISHADCNDGFCAAWLFGLVYPDAVFIACPNVRPTLASVATGDWDEVYILDYSFPRAEMELLAKRVGSLVVLDHHATAEADCVGLDFCLFDKNRSGAMLAYDYLNHRYPHLGDELCGWREKLELVRYVQDRDLWTKKLDGCDDVHAALNSYPKLFGVWNGFDVEKLKEEGKVINRYRERTIVEHVKRAVLEDFYGHKVYLVNCSTKDICSEVAGLLAVDRPFGVSYVCTGGGKCEYSLRSTPKGIDVSLIAKAHGGGGHKQAAGFTV